VSVLDPRHDGPDTDSLLRRVIDILEGARTLPLSSSVKLDNKDEVLDLLDEALERLPEECRQARWMLKEKQEFLEQTKREADEILEAARLRAEGMVQRTEIVREAGHSARRLIEEARDESRRLRLEAEDYCDQKLAEFEVVLDRTIKTVAAGRSRLSANPAPLDLLPLGATGPGLAGARSLGALDAGGLDPADETFDGADAFFDQDQRA
jgi:vacuolar-type H+-ATPase subunit H